MFESLAASEPQARIRAHRYLLSAGCHLVLIASAVSLTRQRGATTHAQSVDQGIVFVAPQPAHDPPAQRRHSLPRQSRPAPPWWQPDGTAPDLTLPQLPSGVPTVAELLQIAHVDGGSPPRFSPAGPPGTGLITVEPFTATAVDDPVIVLEQPAPAYPSALAGAGISGRVELEYVVDTTGRAEPASLRTLLSTHAAFEAAARVSVLGSRYRPARLRGAAVRQLVRQTLSFRLADQEERR